MGLFDNLFNTEDPTQTTELPAFQQPFVETGFNRALDQLDQPPAVFTGPRIAPLSQTTEQGLDKATQETGQLQDVSDAARFILGDSLDTDPTNRPEFTNSLNAIGQQITTSLQNDILPGVRNRAAAQGAFGGSRQALTEERALQAGSNAIGRAGTDLATQFFSTLTNARLGALQQVPNVLGATVAPSSQLRDVGNTIDARSQSELEDQVQRFNEVQQAPELALDRFLSRVLGNIGQTTTVNRGNDPLRNVAAGVGVGTTLAGATGKPLLSGTVGLLASLLGGA